MSDTAEWTYISEGLRHLAYPIGDLKPLPGNPRRGNVDAVAASYATFGQRKPIVARRDDNGDNIILAGNTQWEAARQLGWSHIAVEWVDDDEQKAAAFALADNRTHDLGSYDDNALMEMLKKVEDPALRDAAGFDLADMQELLNRIDTQEEFEEATGAPMTGAGGVGSPVVQTTIVFDDEEQQAVWFRFVRWMKQVFPDEDTLAARLTRFLEGILEGEDSGGDRDN